MSQVPEHMSMRRIRRIHFVGIGGAGMGGIAEVLVNLGYKVSGSDQNDNAMTRHLAGLGVHVYRGHDASYVNAVDVVVVSTAIQPDNIELEAARAARIPVVRRAEMLAELMRFRYGIAVAGTHGKTTTTSLVASLMAEGGLDPTFIIGGRLNSTATHSRLGDSHYLVAEADESDASFLHLLPMISVITNIDADHLGTYSGDYAQLERVFEEFVHHLPFYGLAVVCVDDPGIQAILPRLNRPLRTYGIDSAADVMALDIRYEGTNSHFNVRLPGRSALMPVTLNLPGHHNVLNALAAIAVTHDLAVSDEAMQTALARFEGISRRFQVSEAVKTQKGSVVFVDDYGHHPTEISATVDAVRKAWPTRRLVVIFQPHRYTRTRDLFEDFVSVLSGVDVLILTEVYAAGEEAIPSADGRSLSRAIRVRGQVEPVFVEDIRQLPETLINVIQDGDVILTLGAGSIGSVAAQLPESLGAPLTKSQRRGGTA